MHKLILISLSVDGYNRLALSDTKSYTITPKNIHLILGTNGSGKSSILELITPLPPNRKDFKEGGYKDIVFQYDKDTYRIYSQDNKHTVYKNGIIVLDNVGVKMIVDLCKDYFNITPQLHKFMLGKINITNMSLQDRKEFITSISHIDYDYANKIYTDLKKKLRDEQAISKHLQNKILSLKSFILNEEEVLKLKNRKDQIDNAMSILYKYKSPNKNYHAIEYDKYSSLVNNTSDILTYCIENNLLGNNDTIKDKLAVLKSEKNNKVKQRDEISNMLYEMSKLLDSNTIESDLSTINKTIESLQASRLLPNTRDYYNHIVETINTYGDMVTIFNRLLDSLYNLNKHSISELRKTYHIIIDDIDSHRTKISILNTKITSITDKQKDYMSISSDMICTHCGTPIINDKLLQLLDKDKALAVKYNDEMTVLDKELKLLLEDDIHKQIETLEYALSILKKIELDRYIDNLDSILSIYNKINIIYTDLQNYPSLLNAIDSKNELLTLSNNLLDETKYKNLEMDYDRLNLDIDRIEIDEKKISNDLAKLLKLDSNILEIGKLLKQHESLRKLKLVNKRNDCMDMLLEDLKKERIELNIQLDKYNHSINEESTLSKELAKSLNDIKLLEIMISELSPSTGLIADSVKSFLVKYIDEVNEIINSVWSYRLDVMPYDINDLDKGITYRFPVRTEDNDNSDDIANTSESMREIISLAFRLVSLKYLGMSLYPLMIDEFGRSMDEVHLIKSYDMLEDLVDENDIQMFIIAHIKTAYARFTNAGISIVSNLNLEEI